MAAHPFTGKTRIKTETSPDQKQKAGNPPPLSRRATRFDVKKRCRAVSAVCLLVSLASSATAADLEPKHGGTLRVGIDGTIIAVNPYRARYRQHFSYPRLYTEGLVDLNKKAEIVPGLAESWEISSDGMEYTFKIRPSVSLHNGDTLTAEDVKWSLDYVRDPKNGAAYRGNLSSTKSIETAGPLTVKVRFKEPFGPPFLADIYGTFVPIVSRKSGPTLDTKPIGTGPFTVADWNPGLNLRLERFPDYRKKGRPYLDEIVLRFLPEETVRYTALRTGDIDVADGLPIQAVTELKKAPLPGIQFVAIPGGEYMMLLFNTRKPPLSDVRLRQAFAYALDKQEIVNADRWGYGEVVNQTFPKSSPWHFELEDYKRDPNKARGLLSGAGFPQGLALPILVSPKYLSTAQVLQTQLKAVGIKLDFQLVDDATRVSQTDKGEFAMMLRGQGFPLDPNRDLDMFYSKARNPSGYSNPDFDRLYEQGRVERDFQKRKQIYREAMRLVIREVPSILIWGSDSFVGWRDRVKGFDLNIARIPIYDGGGIESTRIEK
jgi:peptide/nickel transport system substrate-binding protein